MASQLSLSLSPLVSWKAIVRPHIGNIQSGCNGPAWTAPGQYSGFGSARLGFNSLRNYTLLLRLWEPYQAYGLRSVTPCSSVDRYWHYRRTCFFYLHGKLKMEAESFFEKLVPIYKRHVSLKSGGFLSPRHSDCLCFLPSILCNEHNSLCLEGKWLDRHFDQVGNRFYKRHVLT